MKLYKPMKEKEE